MNASVVARGKRACALVVFVLGGCGGGGGASDSGGPPVVTAADDNIVVAWNVDTTLAVTVNDSTSAGTLSVSSVDAPAHGQAHIDGGKIVYTPQRGYFGTDTLSYTVSAANGGQSSTANATVHLDVTASLQLSGTVTDGPIANAKVDVAVGARHQAVTADAQGHYQATVQSDDPTAFVAIEATGAGAQSFVKLRTLAGTFGSLAADASQGAVNASLRPALDVTHMSTALAVLTTQANNGKEPVSDEELSAATRLVDPGGWVDMAAGIQLLVDGSMSLPIGSSDTLALVSSPDAYRSFLQSLAVQQTSDRFETMRTAVRQAMSAGAPTLFKSGVAQTVVLYTGGALSPGDAYLVETTADGHAAVAGDISHASATVTYRDDAVVLSFDPAHPIDSHQDVEWPAGQQAPADFRVDTIALELRQALGANGILIVTPQRTRTYLTGPLAGQTMEDPTSGAAFMMQAMDYANRLSIQASEFTPGARWVGFLPGSARLEAGSGTFQDAFDFPGNSTAKAVLDGSTYAFSVSESVLRLTSGSTVRDYVRLATGLPTGQEAWVAIERDSGGNAIAAKFVGVVPSSAALTWTAGAAAHVWQLYEAADGNWIYRLHQDAGMTVEWDYWALGNTSVVKQTLAWQFNDDGSVAITRHLSSGTGPETQMRTWIPIRRAGQYLCMLETLKETDDQTQEVWYDARRLHCIADMGPSSP